MIEAKSISSIPIIVPFREERAAETSRLARRAVRAAFRCDYPVATIRRIRCSLSPGLFAQNARESLTLLAIGAGKVVGTGSLMDEWIHSLYVAPEEWRRGVGTALISALERQASPGMVTRLFSSLPAEPFYRRLGYRAVRTIDDPLRPMVEMLKTHHPSPR